MEKKHLLFIAIMAMMLFCNNMVYGQGMAVNTTGTTADASAMLDVASTTQGMLVPRMTTTQRTSISNPATGLLVYDLTLGAYYFNSGTPTSPVWTAVGGIGAGTYTGEILYWNGSAWVGIGAGSSGQLLTLVSGIPTWVSLPSESIVATSGANGTVSPAGTTTLSFGGSQVYSITPSTGYAVSSVTVDGSSVGAVSTYTFSAVAASHTISATFAAETFSITATSGANGSVSPSGTTTVSYGGSEVYSITPSTGYAVSSVTVDGSSVGAVSTYTFSAVAASHTISATFAASLAIGQSYEGGIIAYILQPTDPGYSATVTHGLIAATSDQSTGAAWGCYGTTTGATGTAIGTGQSNTTAILAACTTSGIAAQICHAYSGGGYTDWYLPSLNELSELYNNRTAIGGFSATYYWSSSEYNSSHAWFVFFATFAQNYGIKTVTAYVRAVRAF